MPTFYKIPGSLDTSIHSIHAAPATRLSQHVGTINSPGGTIRPLDSSSCSTLTIVPSAASKVCHDLDKRSRWRRRKAQSILKDASLDHRQHHLAPLS